LRADADLARIDERIFLKDETYRICDLIVIVLFGRHRFQAIKYVLPAWHPPSQDSGQTLVRKAGHLALQEYRAFILPFSSTISRGHILRVLQTRAELDI
jgi:hypothetical protein